MSGNEAGRERFGPIWKRNHSWFTPSHPKDCICAGCEEFKNALPDLEAAYAAGVKDGLEQAAQALDKLGEAGKNMAANIRAPGKV